MKPEDWDWLGPLFERAMKMGPEERRAFLDSVLAAEPERGRELGLLVRAHEALTQSVEGAAKGRCFDDGEVVLGRFRVVRMIGRGGMGEVYEAEDGELGRVALKTIRAEYALNVQMFQRFRQEVRLARLIASPLVVRIHDMFSTPGEGKRPPIAFLTMEYLEGVTLEKQIGKRGLEREMLEPAARDLCAAVEAIHEAGIVHRDLKPSNVMLTRRGQRTRPVVLDMGLARMLDPEAETGLTQTGMFVGTRDYAAPEQLDGRPAAASDIYALGEVLYAMVTGRGPYEGVGSDAAEAIEARRTKPPRPSGLRADAPKRWDAVIERCLEYEPERRFATAGEVARALEGRRWVSGRSWTAGIAAVLAVVGLGIGARWFGNVPPPVDAEAMRFYRKGAEALEEGMYWKAKNELATATGLDAGFARAWAALADASQEMDFTEEAGTAMLRASDIEAGGRLTARDRLYIDSVREKITWQYGKAEAGFAKLAQEAPEAEKAFADLDLGRSYEGAGDAQTAGKWYREAARLAPHAPAPFVRLGILEDRRGERKQADEDFERAEALYTAGDPEGIAEVEYRRGYAAASRGDTAAAKPHLDQALRRAQDLGDPQLEVRTLIDMGVVADLEGHLAECERLEGEAMKMAADRGLEYWVLDARTRLADAYQYRSDYEKAEPLLEDVERRAGKRRMERLEARARLQLADIRWRRQSPEEGVKLAQEAVDYYARAGFAGEELQARVVILRAEWAMGKTREALAEALAAEGPAAKAGKPIPAAQLEELAGGILMEGEKYAEALKHFQAALSEAEKGGQLVENETAHCADALWGEGRLAEAEREMAKARGKVRAATEARVEGQIRLSRGDWAGALAEAKGGLGGKGLTIAQQAPLREIEALALAGMGRGREAERAVEEARALAAGEKEAGPEAEAELTAARVASAERKWEEAAREAEEARAYFARVGRAESEFLSEAVEGRAKAAMGDKAGAAAMGRRGREILAAWEKELGAEGMRAYFSRAEMAAARAAVMAI